MEHLSHWIIGHRKLILAVFIVLALVCAVLFFGVDVNYSMVDYLPDDSESTVALNIMNEEFSASVPNARVMVPDLTLTQAVEMKAGIAAVDGVTEVLWLDDIVDLKTPLETQDSATVEAYYKDGAALYTVTIADGMEVSATNALYSLIGEDGAITGDAVNTAYSRESVVTEVVSAACILVPLIIVILLLTTTSWIAPLLFLVTIGVAVIINMGSNIVFGSVSYITQSVSPILQLAVSLDYAIFLLNSFDRFRQTEPDAAVAMQKAVHQSSSSIAASALTTVFGFLALVFMRFRIGSDLGINLVKGVILSYISVMVFLPALALGSVKLLDKTRHRRIIPEMRGIGRGLVRIRIPMLILVLLLVVPCFLGQSRTDFLYGNGDPAAGSRYAADTEKINSEFGESTAIVLLVPRGDTGAETKLCAELGQTEHVTSVISYVTSVGSSIPDGFLSDGIVSNFYSENYSRIIVYTDTGTEGSDAFAVVEAVRSAASEYYGEYWACGESANLYDIKNVVNEDSSLVNGIAIVFILLTLLVTFRSLTLPVILIFVIESAIWINLSIPYFTGTPLVYLGYLVINTVQLGATVDYAILMTDGYVTNRRLMPKREAVEKTLGDNFISVLTSGLILSAAGMVLNQTSTMDVVKTLGLLLARGTLLSLAMVLLALPALLMLLDPLTARLTLRSGFLRGGKKVKNPDESEDK